LERRIKADLRGKPRDRSRDLLLRSKSAITTVEDFSVIAKLKEDE